MSKSKISREDIRVVEALLFASEEVLTQAKLNVCFDDGTVPSLPDVVETLKKEYEKSERAFSIEKVAGGFRLTTLVEYAPWVRRLFTRVGKTPLSQAALETLAVVAYKGPASRAVVESIRGVNSAGVIKTLLERKLIKISGRAKGPGRPLLYFVTEQFLLSFGLDATSDLPKLKEISELIAEGTDDAVTDENFQPAEDEAD